MTAVRRLPLRLARAAAAAFVVAAAGAALAQAPQMYKAGPGPDELWDVTARMEMVGMPMQMPATTSQVCMKKDRSADRMVPQNKDCTMSDVRNVGNRMTFRFVCTGEEPMEGTGEITSTPTSYDGRMTMKGTRRGSDINMVQNFAGKKVGTCTDTSAQAIAKIEGDAAAQKAKFCADSMESLTAAAFVGKDAACASQAKAFCDKVGGLAAGGRTPAGYRAAVGKRGAMMTRPAFTACKQDFDAMQAAACGAGVSSRDWSFVGSGSCDPDVRKQGDAMCKGRAFTGMDRAIVPLCNRYAALSRGAGGEDGDGGGSSGSSGGAGGAGGSGGPGSGSSSTGTAPRAPAKPEEPKPADNAVQEGVNQLRKLLPF